MTSLTKLRKMTKWGIIGIIAGFVLSIVLTSAVSNQVNTAQIGIEIDGTEISSETVDRIIGQALPRGGLLSDTDRKQIAKNAVDQLVQSQLALQQAKKRGLKPTELEIIQEIKRQLFTDPKTGEINEGGYEEARKTLSSNRWNQIAEAIEEQITQWKMNQAVTGSVVITPAALRDYYNIRFQRADVSHIIIRPRELVSTAAVRKYYNANSDSFYVEERVKGRHILWRVPQDAKPEAKFQAQALAQAALFRIKQGTRFNTLYRESLLDTSGLVLAQDLNWFNRGQMVPAFDTVAFNYPVRKATGIIETPFGYHVAYFDAHEKRHRNSLKDAEDIIRRDLVTIEEIDEARTIAEGLKERLDNGEKFEALARKYSHGETAKKNGKLGYVIPGEMTPDLYKDSGALTLIAMEMGRLSGDNRVVIDPAISRLLMRLEINEMSGVVASGLGFHIVRLDGRRKADPLLWFDLQNQVAREFKEYTKRQLYVDWTKSLTTNADIKYSDYVKRRIGEDQST